MSGWLSNCGSKTASRGTVVRITAISKPGKQRLKPYHYWNSWCAVLSFLAAFTYVRIRNGGDNWERQTIRRWVYRLGGSVSLGRSFA
jgi:hypothetical protein